MNQISRYQYIWLALALIGLTLMPVSLRAEPSKDAKAEMMASDWRFHDIVDVDFVLKHFSVPKPKDNVMIIDSRPYQPKYVKGHIPTAVSIPDSQFDKKTDLLPKDKNTLLIFYCGGYKCRLSHKSAKKAEKLGYTNVKVFAAGFPGWVKTPGNYAEVSLEFIEAELDNNTMVLVDARPKKTKYDKGHIPSAISLPDSQFDKLKGKLPRDTSNLLVFYCGGFDCKLSHKSAKKALALGYTNVKVFSAGYPAWKKAHGTGMAMAAIKKGKEEGSIDIASFNEIMTQRPESVLIIDTRDKDEYDKGHITNSINMNAEALEKNIKSLPTDKPIIFVCSTGARSGEAYYMIQDLRPDIKDVYYVEAGLTFKKDGTYEIKPADSDSL